MQKFLYLVLAALIALPATATAASQEDAMMSELQKQIAELSEELEDLNDRLDDAERHATLDRIEFSGDMRYKIHSLHYSDVTFNPGVEVDFDRSFDIITEAAAGMALAGAAAGDFTVAQAMIDSFKSSDSNFNKVLTNYPDMEQAMLAYLAYPSGALGINGMPMLPALKKYNLNNDILQTSRLRLNMKAKVANNVKFSGRLSMFKNWGDSTGAQVFDSWNRFTMDATNSTNTTGDMMRVDRAYFDWSNIANSGVYLSIGRRPSTGGPPVHFRNGELRGGTPTGNVMSLNFDGITIGKHFENIGLEGFTARFCYGQGYESEWGNGEMFNNVNTVDTHFGGLNIDILNGGTNFLQVTAFRAMDINDGFKGVIAFPSEYAELFAPTMWGDMQNFPTFNFVTRVQPSTTIGDIDLGGVVFSREEENGIKWFLSGGLTVLRPNGDAGMFGGMGSDLVYEIQEIVDGQPVAVPTGKGTPTGDEEGYGVYVGVQVPAPMGKFGLEYNYGSEWWTPFNQAIDDPVGSKLATRGHVGEAYYIFDINPRMSFKLSGIYYDYEYTGSGSPVGKPQKIDDIKTGSAYSMLPVVDTAYDLNATMSLKF
jgi:hypothetical protein